MKRVRCFSFTCVIARTSTPEVRAEITRTVRSSSSALVVSEYCWMRDNPPAELVEAHTQGCTDVGDVQDRRRAVDASGYRFLGDFVLPARGWWEQFYEPMGQVVERFRDRYRGVEPALEVAEKMQHEIDLYREYSDYFGYVFFVMQRDDG